MLGPWKKLEISNRRARFFFFQFLFLDFKKKSSKSFFSLVVRRNSVFEQIDLQMGLFGKKKDGAVQVKKLGYEVNSKGKVIHDSRVP